MGRGRLRRQPLLPVKKWLLATEKARYLEWQQRSQNGHNDSITKLHKLT